MTESARNALVGELDQAVRRVDGVGFVTTPFARSDVLSNELGFGADGGVWIKDETGGVGGSQKARHLVTIMLHLRALELLGELPERPPLAIASCGNAALAAATLARAAEWSIDVYVPTWMSDGFGGRLDALGANVRRCERRSDDPAGDPAMLRFREAVERGAVPFTVQGPENALCLDGGRTIGWEIAEQIVAPDGSGTLDAMFVQVGGGAFATCLGAGLVEMGQHPPLMAVQAAGCAPLDRAWHLGATAADDWAAVMTPWTDPASLADGILDDETYDWIGVVEALRATGGETVVASERNIGRAHELAHRAGFDSSPTGSAGLAGLLQAVDGGMPVAGGDRRVGVVISGVTR
jgi:threonine dehydratase